MSRAYKIKVKESARHVLRARDHVSSQLEMLEILPTERMADLLAAELQRRGFKKQGAKLVRQTKDGVVIEHGLTDRLLDDPREPYTQLLVSSILQV